MTECTTDFQPGFKVKDGDWSKAIRHAWQLAGSWIRMPRFDLLIATVGIRTECRVYSLDQHFRQIAGHLPLMLYEPGYGAAFSPED